MGAGPGGLTRNLARGIGRGLAAGVLWSAGAPVLMAAEIEWRFPAAQDTAAMADTTVRQDTLAVQDTVPDSAAADTVVILEFPAFPSVSRLAPGTALHWSHSELMSTGVLTLGDLLEHYGPFDAVRAGFLEGPQALVHAGAGPVGLRMHVDGYAIAPLAGGALDLHAQSMVEIADARVIREPGGYGFRTEPYRRDRAEPYSRIEGGTGDRDANLIRAFFASEFLGAPFKFGFDRVDTDGSAELGGSERTAIWAQASHALPADAWGQLEFRRTSVDRSVSEPYQRTDWIFRIRRPLGDGWHADLVAGAAERELTDEVTDPADGETMAPRTPRRVSARQIAARTAWVREDLRAFLTLRYWDGDPVPGFEPEASIEMTAGPATFYGTARYADWEGFDTRAVYASARVRLPLGLRATGELEAGDQGLFAGRPVGQQSFDRWTLGAELHQLGWTLGVRGGRWRVEPSTGLGLPFDTTATLPGGRVGLFEVEALGSVFRLFGGPVQVGGRYRNRDPGTFLYWPQDEWRLEARYHTLQLDDQLEVRLRTIGGVRGAMRIVDLTAPTVAFPLSPELTWLWAEASVRIKDIYIYYNYEVFDATGGPMDLPGFPLPRARTHFGLKWEFWN